MKGKTICITSGGTLEKWDNVRGHTNLSKGTMGCYLAEAALAQGANVIYMHGYFAKLPENASVMRTIRFEGIEDLGDKLNQLLTTEPIDVVIMAVAGSDWVVDKIYNAAGQELSEQGKMPSDEPPMIKFKKAPKILPLIKQWAPTSTLVGFKLEATDDIEELIARASLRMQSANADFMVANSSNSLYTPSEPHYILARDGSYVKAEGKEVAALTLIELLS